MRGLHLAAACAAACWACARPAAAAPGDGIPAALRAQWMPVVDDIIATVNNNPAMTPPLMVRQAWHAVSTFNAGDPEGRVGGTNGACQRFAAEAGHGANNGVDVVRLRLDEVQARHASFATRADVYALSGNTAFELMGSPPIPFCAGRVDFTAAEADALCPRASTLDERFPKVSEPAGDAFPHDNTRDYLQEKFTQLGAVDVQEIVALMAAGHGVGSMHNAISGFAGPWGDTQRTFDLAFCESLEAFHWGPGTLEGPSSTGDGVFELVHDNPQYIWRREEAGTPLPTIGMLIIDVIMKHHAAFNDVCKQFLAPGGDQLFRDKFVAAWSRMGELGVTVQCDAATPAPPAPTPTPPAPTPTPPAPTPTPPAPTPTPPAPTPTPPAPTPMPPAPTPTPPAPTPTPPAPTPTPTPPAPTPTPPAPTPTPPAPTPTPPAPTPTPPAPTPTPPAPTPTPPAPTPTPPAPTPTPPAPTPTPPAPTPTPPAPTPTPPAPTPTPPAPTPTPPAPTPTPPAPTPTPPAPTPTPPAPTPTPPAPTPTPPAPTPTPPAPTPTPPAPTPTPPAPTPTPPAPTPTPPAPTPTPPAPTPTPPAPTPTPPAPTPTTPAPTDATPPPAILVMPTSGLETTEGGQTATFTLELGTEPTLPVTVLLESADPSEGEPVTRRVVWEPAEWLETREAVVRGVDDSFVDGDVVYTMRTHVLTDDATYSTVDAPDVELTNLDDDVTNPAVLVTVFDAETSESGGVAHLGVRLATAPQRTVAIRMTSEDASEGFVETSQWLRYDAGNWDQVRDVTVQGVDDSVADGDQVYGVGGQIRTRDAGYAAVTVPTVALTNVDDER